jgi:hypothetical protein
VSDSVHLAFSSLYRRTGDLNEAGNRTELAKGIIDNIAAIKITRLIGMYAYEAGRVALAQGRFEESM